MPNYVICRSLYKHVAICPSKSANVSATKRPDLLLLCLLSHPAYFAFGCTLCMSPLPLPQIQHVTRGREGASAGSCITYKHVQRSGVIEELLREVTVACGLSAAGSHGLDEVLLHQHGCQGDGLESWHSKAVGDEPVHQGRTCREKGSSHTKTTCSSEARQMVFCHTDLHLMKHFGTTTKTVNEVQGWPKVWGPPCASIYSKSKRQTCQRVWLHQYFPLGHNRYHHEGSTVVPLSLQCGVSNARKLFACSRRTCEGLFISVALLQVARQLNSSTAVTHSLHYVAENESTGQR